MRAAWFICLIGGCTLAGAVLAQSGPILREEDVTQENILRELVPSRQFTVEPEKKGSLSLLITFQTNSAILMPHTLKSLDVLGRALQVEVLAPYRFVVEGHADPRGSFEGNMRLSQARAQSVVRYLVTNYQIEGSRLRAEGKGSTELYDKVDPTASENRRVTIKRLPKEAE